MYSLQRIFDEKLKVRLEKATHESRLVLEHAKKAGIKIQLIGSLAKGTFSHHSDVDFLVFETEDEKQRIAFDIISSHIKSTQFDVVYFDRLSPETKELMLL